MFDVLTPPSPSHPASNLLSINPEFCALSKPFITMYNPGQTSWDTKLNEIARQIEASSLSLPPPPPGAVLTLCIQVLIQHINTACGEMGTTEIAPYNNIPKLF